MQFPFALYCSIQLRHFPPGLKQSSGLPASSLDSSTLFFTEQPGSFFKYKWSKVIPFLWPFSFLSIFRIKTQRFSIFCEAKSGLSVLWRVQCSLYSLWEEPPGKPSYGKCKVTVQSVGCWVGNKRPWQISQDSSGRQTNRKMDFLFLWVKSVIGQ